ncbi:MAG TPA: hypothetical protein PKI05_07895, partial [Thermogutta sp.]|nr:hypothetical protein [Thermogutta sp.]
MFTSDRIRLLLACLVAGGGLLGSIRATAEEEEVVGKRPYEMDWANRFEDTRPPLIDFEDLEGWTLEARDAVADFRRSREQQIWGKYVGKLTYRGVGPKPVVIIRPPQAVAFRGPVDCVNVWIYGNNWAWVP